MIIKVWPVMLVIGHYTRTYFDSIQSVVQACIGEGGGEGWMVSSLVPVPEDKWLRRGRWIVVEPGKWKN